MANQLLAQSGTEEPSLTIEQKVKKLFLDPKEFSDVCFLVGDKQEKIYAHKVFLVTESEVFKSMFFGPMKETKYEIQIPNLTAVGFRNMIKYFYTKKVEIDLSEVHATYMAANKYLALALMKDLTNHIIRCCSDVKNSCLVYDQLLKLSIDDPLINNVKEKISAGCSAACANDSFKQLSEDTLVSILKFTTLNVTELELLKACIRWTDSEVARKNLEADQANKRKVFEPIKHLIRFGDLNLNGLSSISNLENYFTFEEIGSIFVHLSQRGKPIQIEYQSPRESRKV